MGKNQKHKKALKSEKSKIKLKTKPGAKTKFLPKGANVTDVNFKIKPIVLLEQLKLSTDEYLTKRKLNFKDLLTRLNHHNSSAKNDACEGLLELIHSCSPEVIEQNLYSLSQGVCKLVLDIDRKTRQKAIKILSDMIGKVSVSKLLPFYDILAKYTSCAMTHIDRNIQEDSLFIIDAYIKYTPLLIVKSLDKILTNFLSLVSKLRSDSQLRTVTITLGSKMTSVMWRIKVLSRLQSILEVISSEKSKLKELNSNNCLIINAADAFNGIPLYKGEQRCLISVLNNSSGPVASTDGKIEQYIGVLMPLLYETWAEVVPLKTNILDDGYSVIQQDAASMLGCVVGIFYLLWQLVHQTDANSEVKDMKKLFFANEGEKFLSHILNQFPYHQHDMQKQKQKNVKDKQVVDVNWDVKCVRENLMISYLFCSLFKTLPNQFHVTKAQDVLKYLRVCLVNRNYVTAENIETLTLTLRIIFFNNFHIWTKQNVNIEALLDNVVQFHNNLSVDNYGKIKIFNLLCDVVELLHLRSPKYEHWLSKLPCLLCKSEISEQVVDTLSLLSRQNNALFLNALLRELPNILENLPSIKVKGSCLYPPHLKIVNMLYYVTFQQDHFELCKKFVAINDGSKIADYVRHVMQAKLRN